MNVIRSVVFFLATASAIHAQKSFPDYFPMEKGTRWTYTGKVDWTYEENKIGSGRKTVSLIVEDYFEAGGVKVALLRGGPWDLAWWEPNSKASHRLLVRRGNRFYLSFDSDGQLFRTLRQGIWPEAKIEQDFWFNAPLRLGDEFCDPDDEWRIAKHETDYCWYVARQGKAPVRNIGISSSQPWFDLRFQTNPDHEIDTVVPGIGITHFVYSHHGTVSNVDVKLVAFRRGTKHGTRTKPRTTRTSR